MSEQSYADQLRSEGFVVSEIGARCAELAGRFYAGLHHFPGGDKGLRRVDWNHWLFCKWNQHNGLTSYDGDSLTRLVMLAHDLGIRVEVNPRMRYLEIVCHPRVFVKTTGRCAPHPTVEAAVADWRRRNQVRLVMVEGHAGQEESVSREECILSGMHPPMSRGEAECRAMIASQFGVDDE